MGSLYGAYGSDGLGLMLLTAVAAGALVFAGTGIRGAIAHRAVAARPSP